VGLKLPLNFALVNSQFIIFTTTMSKLNPIKKSKKKKEKDNLNSVMPPYTTQEMFCGRKLLDVKGYLSE